MVDDDDGGKEQPLPPDATGVANTVLIEKTGRRRRERSDSLEACAELGRRLNNLGHSIGIALGACPIPAAGQPSAP